MLDTRLFCRCLVPNLGYCKALSTDLWTDLVDTLTHFGLCNLDDTGPVFEAFQGYLSRLCWLDEVFHPCCSQVAQG